MPLLFKKQYSGIDCAVWRVTESPEDLASALSEADVASAVVGLRSVKRKVERLSVRVLLRLAFPAVRSAVTYDRDGRPMLEASGLDVSFSHTTGYAAVALSASRVGIDVERLDGRALRLVSRFMNDDERACLELSPNPEADAVMIWSAKEVAYKIFGREVYDYRHTVNVIWGRREGELDIEVKTQQRHEIIAAHYAFYDDFVIVTGHGAVNAV